MEEKIDTFEVIVLALSFFVIVSLIIQQLIPINQEVIKLLNFFEIVSCFVFVVEWFKRFFKAKNKIKFTLLNSLDLLASIPIYYMQGFKAIRLIRIMRIIKLIGSITRLSSYFNKNKKQVFKLLFFIIFIVVMLVSPILILHFEHLTGSINTAEKALWWTYCTITTIGYGDLYPVTTEGRILTVFVTIGGISLFGILSSMIINYIINLNLNEKN